MGQIYRVEPEDHLPEVREPAGYRHTDAEIARELRECLADDVGLDSRGIEVEVKNGEVTLGGSVRTCADMKRVPSPASSWCATGFSRRSRCRRRNRNNLTARPPRWASRDTSVDLAAHTVFVSR